MIHIEPMDIEERSSKMMLHWMRKKHFYMLFIAFTLLYLAILIIGGVGPNSANITTTTIRHCQYDINNTAILTPCHDISREGNITITASLKEMKKTNQYIYLYIMPHPTSLDVFSNVGDEFVIPTVVYNSNSTESVDSGMSDTDLVEDTFTMLCSSRYGCLRSPLLYIQGITKDTYDFKAVIQNFAGSEKIFNGNLDIQVEFQNSGYTIMSITFRTVFIVTSSLVLAGFIYSLHKYNWRSWTLEQQWIVIILVFLILYNNPFYLLTISVKGNGAQMLNDFFFTSFYSILFCFWFVIFDGVRRNGHEFKFVEFYLPKILLSGSFFLSSLVAMSIYEYHLSNHPLDNIIFNAAFNLFTLISSIILVIFLGYLIYLVARGLVTTRTIPMISIKIKILFVFGIVVMVLMVLGELFSFFKAFNNSMGLLSSIGLFNLYIYVLAILYLPHPNSELMYQSSILRNDGAEMPSLNDKETDEFDDVYL